MEQPPDLGQAGSLPMIEAVLFFEEADQAWCEQPGDATWRDAGSKSPSAVGGTVSIRILASVSQQSPSLGARRRSSALRFRSSPNNSMIPTEYSSQFDSFKLKLECKRIGLFNHNYGT